MNNQTSKQGLHLFLIAALVAVLMLSIAPVQSARAQEIITRSDLAVSVISVPKHAKACQVFEATYTVTNLGPDPASNLYVVTMIPDHFDLVGVMRAPEYLGVGDTATFTVVIKVTAFVPGETRDAWLGVDVASDVYPNTFVDPNLENNAIFRDIRMISKPIMNCWE